MSWLVVGCCGLVLINMSGALNDALTITQRPRFCGLKHSHEATFKCYSSKPVEASSVQWAKVKMYDKPPEKGEQLEEGGRIQIKFENQTTSVLVVSKLQTEDSGVYFCGINNKWGAGSELHVARSLSRIQATYRSQVKDGLMVLQGLLLAIAVGALMLHKRKLLEQSDSLYEEPETDHIYEGLTIETCGGGLYEELSVYAQPEGAEAPWE